MIYKYVGVIDEFLTCLVTSSRIAGWDGFCTEFAGSLLSTWACCSVNEFVCSTAPISIELSFVYIEIIIIFNKR